MNYTEIRDVELWSKDNINWYMIGAVYNDRWFADGQYVMTTRIIDVESRDTDLIITTKNTTYLIKDYVFNIKEESLTGARLLLCR